MQKGHWSCADCAANVCPTCRPSKTAQDLTDPAGHILTWSTENSHYFGMKFDCKACKKVLDAEMDDGIALLVNSIFAPHAGRLLVLLLIAQLLKNKRRTH